MAAQQPTKSALNKTGQKTVNHVAFGETPGENKTRSTIQPAASAQLKDEVELLRGGFKNNHGEQVKSQGQQGESAGGTQSNGGPNKENRNGAVQNNI